MFEVAGGLVLFILAWMAIQLCVVVVSFIFHSISDWYYSARRNSRQLGRR